MPTFDTRTGPQLPAVPPENHTAELRLPVDTFAAVCDARRSAALELLARGGHSPGVTTALHGIANSSPERSIA